MSPTFNPPDYAGGSLVNLVAEVEFRLTGSAASSRLHARLASAIPNGDSYVMVVMDGLGSSQLQHPAARSLADAEVAPIDAPFPTTTTVSLATIATGLAPSEHGLLGYQLHLPETIDPRDPRRTSVVNTIKWTRLWGEAVDFDAPGFLPSPNLWERLSAAGVEPITVQPGNFLGSQLSRVLYRDCRFEPVFTPGELVDATVELSAVDGRLIVMYLPQVDFAAHLHGQDHPDYAQAMRTVDGIWSSLSARLPASVALLGTADHGHVDYPKERQVAIPAELQTDRVLYGDSRAMFVVGDGGAMAEQLPATWVPVDQMTRWWGHQPVDASYARRRPDGVLMADDGYVLLHRHSDERLIGHHGGLGSSERQIPLLVRAER